MTKMHEAMEAERKQKAEMKANRVDILAGIAARLREIEGEITGMTGVLDDIDEIRYLDTALIALDNAIDQIEG